MRKENPTSHNNQNTKGPEQTKYIQSNKGKVQVTYQVRHIRISPEFSTETPKAKEWLKHSTRELLPLINTFRKVFGKKINKKISSPPLYQ